MADAGRERQGPEPDKKDEADKGKIGLTAKARKARAARRRKRPNSRRRVSLIAAIANPVRRRILRAISDYGEPCSPAQIARQLGLPVGTVAYHARVLWHLGAVEPVAAKHLRDATEPFYDSTIENDPPIEALLDETREVDEDE